MKQRSIDDLESQIMRTEDCIMNFAERNKLTSFIDKWGTKSYLDSDHTVDNMLDDLLANLSKDFQEYYL